MGQISISRSDSTLNRLKGALIFKISWHEFDASREAGFGKHSDFCL